MKKAMILVIDGCAPEYLMPQTAPGIYSLAAKCGFAKTVECAMPSVTNVNHACILSGKWSEETKVVGNYYYDPLTGNEGFIEERGYMKAKTILEWYREQGGSTALLTVKGKVLGVYGEGVDIGLSAQKPDRNLLERYQLAQPPAIDSVEATEWIVNAAYEILRKDSPDFLYCTTNDFVFHHFAPGTPEAASQIRAIDQAVSKIARQEPERQVYITADHGMNQKTTIINFQRVADEAGFHTYCLPPLKDRYVENHIYQEGGMLYVYLQDPKEKEMFFRFAQEQPYMEAVLTAKQAAEEFHLPINQIGDLVLLAERESAFGECEKPILHTWESRTHGSRYEREIPLIAMNPERQEENYKYSKDIVAYMMES